MYSWRLASGSLLCVTLQLLEAWAAIFTMHAPVSDLAAAVQCRVRLLLGGTEIVFLLARRMAPLRELGPIILAEDGKLNPIKASNSNIN